MCIYIYIYTYSIYIYIHYIHMVYGSWCPGGCGGPAGHGVLLFFHGDFTLIYRFIGV